LRLGDDDLVRIVARVNALDAFLKSDDGANLLAGYKRAVNILKAEEKKGPLPTGAAVRMATSPPEELALIAAAGELDAKLDAALDAEDFAGAMRLLSALARAGRRLLRQGVSEFRDIRGTRQPAAPSGEGAGRHGASGGFLPGYGLTRGELRMAGTTVKTRWVYAFGGGKADGDASMKDLLGGKGANLAEMSALGLPVPPGFTITTEACNHYYDNDQTYPANLKEEVAAGLKTVEQITGKAFGDAANPLLVSVRSGARASMPGMMDTVLNLGLNDQTVEGLAKLSGDRRFAFDSYRRFIQMYSNVVLDIDHHMFEEILDDHKDRLDIHVDTGLSAEDWEAVVADYKKLVQDEIDRPFPQDPHEQLWGAIGAVFASWMNDRAKFYRRMHDIPESWGTAVNIQSMVFGNMGDGSATGVAFTRNPSTGDNRLYGEFLINAQGEDVVAGIRTPQPLTKIAREEMGDINPSMEEALPEVFAQFKDVVGTLEKHYRDMQDIEFTVERGRLYMLQTRNGKRTAKAALKVAVDLASEGLISHAEAVMRVEPASLDQLLHPTIDPASPRDVIATGLPASPGAATGKVVFTAEEAEKLGGSGEAGDPGARGDVALRTSAAWTPRAASSPPAAA
jgi:pyruvate,orthophosphate dikinase